MNTSADRRIPVLLLCLFAFSVSGCSDGPFSGLSAYNPFERDDPADLDRYGPTPAQRIRELRSLASQADRMDAATHEKSARDLVQQYRTEEDPALRSEVVRTLGAFRTESSLAALRTATQDKDSDVRVLACEAWGKTGGPDAVNVLAEVLGSNTDVDVRLAAARALGNFRDPSAVRALALALDDGDPALQYRAVQSLKSASGRDYGDDLAAWRRYADGQMVPETEGPSFVERVRQLF